LGRLICDVGKISIIMKIPNSKHAIVDIGKLKKYCLNTRHRIGRNKARLFASALGVTIDDAEALREILLSAVQEYDAKIGLKDDYGQRYQIDFPMSWNQKQAMVRCTWIIEPDVPNPRLTSCYVLKNKEVRR